MDVRYFFDPETEQQHIYDHGLTKQEVEEALRACGEDLPAARNLRMLLGQTSADRYLQVIYVPDSNDTGVFVITAYDLQGKAKTAFRRSLDRKAR